MRKSTRQGTSSEALHKLASTVRDQFLAQKRRRIGYAQYVLPKKLDSEGVWARAARLCADMKVDPAEFVAACFAQATNPAGPTPDMIGGEFAKAALKRQAADAVQQPAMGQSIPLHEFDHESATVIKELNEHFDSVVKGGCMELSEALSQVTLTSDHWFRIFKMPDDERIWHSFGYAGMKQLEAAPRLVLYLQGLDPATMDILKRRPLPPKPIWFDDEELA